MSEGLVSSRRRFVVGGAVLGAALPVVSLGDAALAAPFPHLDAADWKKQVGLNFAVAGENGTASMKLIGIKGERKLRAPYGAKRGHSFTAVFEMDEASAPKGGQTYQVRHPEFGATPLYLERTIQQGGRTRLRASFS